MNGYRTFLMLKLAECAGVISKELEYDLAWTEGELLLKEFDKSKFIDQKTTEYQAMCDFIETKEKTAFKDCHKCKDEYLPTPDFDYCPHCLTSL